MNLGIGRGHRYAASVGLRAVVRALAVAAAGIECGQEPGAPAGDPQSTPVSAAAVPGLPVEPASSAATTATLELVAGATRYASLSASACVEELTARAIPHQRLGPTRGVVVPVKLTGALAGVTFRTLLPEKARALTPYEIFDCRLVLALHDFARLLVAQNIVEVIHYSAYRPPPAGWSEGPFGVRHDGGLAIDVGYFRSADGTALNVERDFAARRGERPCAPGPPPRDATAESIALRRIVCDGLEAKLFHLILTPAYDRTHRDHFHFEVTPGASTFVAR